MVQWLKWLFSLQCYFIYFFRNFFFFLFFSLFVSAYFLPLHLQLDSLADFIITLLISSLKGQASFVTPLIMICWGTNNGSSMFTSEAIHLWRSQILFLHSHGITWYIALQPLPALETRAYQKKLSYKTDQLFLLISDCSIFSITLLLLIKFVHCTFAPCTMSNLTKY